jgi:hypothetical protein
MRDRRSKIISFRITDRMLAEVRRIVGRNGDVSNWIRGLVAAEIKRNPPPVDYTLYPRIVTAASGACPVEWLNAGPQTRTGFGDGSGA